ncbi:pyridoxamine 5'-phosphate oxidase family protein [Fretibacter rubidus]|uniref:pyridoxamine 5'-phosphate oxidase family protein n=1 Tax=Fretibacter rubidus TaxID=570162 RepID=UPI00352B55F3
MTYADKIENLFEIINDLNIGMLVSENGGELRSRPMKAFTDKDTNTIWFLTHTRSAKVLEISQDQDVNLSFACPKENNYVSVSGKASLSRDAEKIDDMWSDKMAVWFDCEKNDPAVAAICVSPTTAEYWKGEDSGLKRMWEITKAKVTDTKPDLGDNETVCLAG